MWHGLIETDRAKGRTDGMLRPSIILIVAPSHDLTWVTVTDQTEKRHCCAAPRKTFACQARQIATRYLSTKDAWVFVYPPSRLDCVFNVGMITGAAYQSKIVTDPSLRNAIGGAHKTQRRQIT